jgi:hypothetical protein
MNLRNTFIYSNLTLEVKVKNMKNKKAIVFTIISLLMISSIAMTVQAAVAKPSIMENVANRLMQANWAKMNGNIEKLGDTEVRGQLQTQIRTSVRQTAETKEVISATAIWTKNLAKDIQPGQATEDKTYTYYIARLSNDSIIDFTSNQGTYEIQGTWKLAEITVTITVEKDAQGIITNVHKEQDIKPSTAKGILTINTADNKFTLTIETSPDKTALSGSIYRSVTRSWFNPFKMTDGTTSNVITRTDVKTIAKCYGASPGWGNFDLGMDFNHNYRVDIADISSVAAAT